MFRPPTIHPLIRLIYPQLTWRIPVTEKTLFLTFDDGPTPHVTEWILEQLERYKARATFFCIGKNVITHPSIFQKVIEQGHSIGNHTYDHLHGWKTPFHSYLENVRQCSAVFGTYLFRPPYGKITHRQIRAILKNRELLHPKQSATPIPQDHKPKIIMWDVLSWDFDTKVSAEKCLSNVLDHTKAGSIIVFHDSRKAFYNMAYALPKVLDFFTEKGYLFKGL